MLFLFCRIELASFNKIQCTPLIRIKLRPWRCWDRKACLLSFGSGREKQKESVKLKDIENVKKKQKLRGKEGGRNKQNSG